MHATATSVRTARITLLLALSLSLVPMAGRAWAGEPPTALVSGAGNAADTNGSGAVADPFLIGTHEVTNLEYRAFLNAVAASDDHALFDENIMTDSDRGGILRRGSPGNYTYALKPDFADKPVNGIAWADAARYCNWLHNGMPSGTHTSATTEDGAYDMSQGLAAITRRSGAQWFLPSLDEWYKAAYHDPFVDAADLGGTADYWAYPTRFDVAPTRATADSGGGITNPGPNVANTSGGADWNGENGNVTTVGGTQASSAWGAFDMAGNLYEWTETLDVAGPNPTRTAMGGDFSNATILARSSFALAFSMDAGAANVGFRVASRWEAWADLGHALGGTHGDPLLVGTGTLVPLTPLSLTLTNALESSIAIVVVGVVRLDLAHFTGGFLVPAFELPLGTFFAIPTDATGGFQINTPWPAGLPTDITIYLQTWNVDDAGPVGFSASNAISGTTPP